MRASVRASLANIIDYAGLFPPAKLSMPDAVDRYLRAAESPERWMLGRFVCPAARLGELWELLSLRDHPAEFEVVALGRGGQTADDFRKAVHDDVRDVREFRQRAGADRVPVLEVALPPTGSQTEAEAAVGDAIAQHGGAGLRVFFEVPRQPGWEDRLAWTAGRLAQAVPRTVGLKLRCGGPNAAAVPGVAPVRKFLEVARRHSVPWKATAGLHHPLRHHDATLGTDVHGFLNVFLAGVVLHSGALAPAALDELLGECTLDRFAFSEGGLQWREWGCTSDQVSQARRDFCLSFGSCSFDEPRDDLKALGLID